MKGGWRDGKYYTVSVEGGNRGKLIGCCGAGWRRRRVKGPDGGEGIVMVTGGVGSDGEESK